MCANRLWLRVTFYFTVSRCRSCVSPANRRAFWLIHEIAPNSVFLEIIFSKPRKLLMVKPRRSPRLPQVLMKIKWRPIRMHHINLSNFHDCFVIKLKEIIYGNANPLILNQIEISILFWISSSFEYYFYSCAFPKAETFHLMERERSNKKGMASY